MKLSDVILRDTRANQPAATAVPVATLYCVTDENDIVERSDGATWEAFSPTGGGTGDVVGPASAVDDRIATFDGTTGKLIQDGGSTIADVLAAAGDVDGPASSVDGEIALFDSTTGKLLKRATGSGIVRVSSGVYGTPGAVDLTTEVTGDLPLSNLAQASAASRLLGRGSAAGAGDYQEITLGSGLSMTGTALSATGSGGNITSATEFGSEPGSPTAGDLDLYTNSFYIARYSGSAWVPWGPIYPMTAPVNGDFSWVNEGSATVATTNGGILLSTPAEAASNIHLRVKSAPSTPYTIIGRFLRSGYHLNNACGLTFRQSSDGKLHLLWVDGIGTFNARSRKFTNPTTFSADYGSVTPIIPQGVIHLRIQDDGTNRIVSYSNDGFNWDAVFTIGRTDFLTADQVGFFISAQTTSSLCSIRLLSWEQS